jgi:hypothetical protein
LYEVVIGMQQSSLSPSVQAAGMAQCISIASARRIQPSVQPKLAQVAAAGVTVDAVCVVVSVVVGVVCVVACMVATATQHFDVSSVSVHREGFAHMVSSASGIVS